VGVSANLVGRRTDNDCSKIAQAPPLFNLTIQPYRSSSTSNIGRHLFWQNWNQQSVSPREPGLTERASKRRYAQTTGLECSPTARSTLKCESDCGAQTAVGLMTTAIGGRRESLRWYSWLGRELISMTQPFSPKHAEDSEVFTSLPAWVHLWHMWKVFFPRRSIQGPLVWGRVWRRHDGQRWLYKPFVEFDA